MKAVGDILDLSFEIKVVRPGADAAEVVRFAELLTGPTVVSIYMRNNTGSCDKQNVALVADAAAIRDRGYEIIALSRDTGGSHARYAAKLGVDYPLVSDPDNHWKNKRSECQNSDDRISFCNQKKSLKVSHIFFFFQLLMALHPPGKSLLTPLVRR